MHYELSLPGAGRESIIEYIRANNLDGLLLTSAENVYYTSGLPVLPGCDNPILFALRNQLPSFVYLDASGTATLLCWIGATSGFTFPVDEVRSFFSAESALDELNEFLSPILQRGPSIGIENSCPLGVFRHLLERPEVKTVFIDQGLLELRLRKTAPEVERLRAATSIVEATCADLREYIKPGISRLQLINLAKRQMLAHGASGIGHTTIAFGTSNPEIACDETLTENQLVTLDLGATVAGYTSDNRRLFYTGTIPDDLWRLHQTVCEIVEQVGLNLKPGVAFTDLYNLAVELYTEHDLLPFFISIGHCIGLQTEEAWIDPTSPYTLQAGMVLNIELYSAYEDGSNIGNEETFLVTNEGALKLTSSNPAIQSVPIGDQSNS